MENVEEPTTSTSFQKGMSFEQAKIMGLEHSVEALNAKLDRVLSLVISLKNRARRSENESENEDATIHASSQELESDYDEEPRRRGVQRQKIRDVIQSSSWSFYKLMVILILK